MIFDIGEYRKLKNKKVKAKQQRNGKLIKNLDKTRLNNEKSLVKNATLTEKDIKSFSFCKILKLNIFDKDIPPFNDDDFTPPLMTA